MSGYVSYVRVSTDKQGINGLGMDAQREIIKNFLRGSPVVQEFAEVETGRYAERPELNKALALCRKTGAVLLIAKLDRLARNAAFTLSLKESGVEFIACDMPQANRLTIGIMALMAEHEREQISQRTREGMAVAMRRGVKMGNPRWQESISKARTAMSDKARSYKEGLKPIIQEIRAAGVTTCYGIAKALNARGIKSFMGKKFTSWVVNEMTR